ncbi:MAG: endonuclease domain-containing protein [Brevundimonas sp.]|uniref:endonuclease domain-containing protein n=1 Tax=Brevundimonas sp. TaxID=1871086 RepID=UPI0040348BC1
MHREATYAQAKRLRRPLTPPEARLWLRLRARRLAGLKFRRQHPVGPYILDFYCVSAKLAVEVDGVSHDNPAQAEHDRKRTFWLSRRGIRVVRIAARDVRYELDGVLAFLARVAGERSSDAGDALT